MNRNIAVCIILTLITCGIYGIYWFVKVTGEMNALSNEPNPTNPVLQVMLVIITCGIYGYYWAYKMGAMVDRVNGTENGNTSVLYLILEIFLPIAVYALAQDCINQKTPTTQA